MSLPTRVATAVGAGAVVAALALPGAALAADTSPAPSRSTATVDRALKDSPSFGGYIAPLKKDKSIVGTFTVPTLDCGATDEGTASLIEMAVDDGAQWVDGLVFSICSGGVGSHQAVFDTTTADGQVPIDEVVEDGDKIKVEQTFTRGKFKVTMKNLTQDWSAKGTFEGFTPDEASSLVYSVEIEAGAPSLPPLSSDSKASGVKVGGKDLKDANPVKYTWVDDDGGALVKASKIKKGTDFTFNYVG